MYALFTSVNSSSPLGETLSFEIFSKYITPITTPELKQVAQRPGKVKMSTGKVERATGIRMLRVEEGLKILKEQLVKR